jgi:hypothetical protein
MIRKGQFIVNHLHFKLKVPETRIGGYLFAMLDEEFEEIEHEYRKYAITKLHDPKEWEEGIELAEKMFGIGKKRKKAKPAS